MDLKISKKVYLNHKGYGLLQETLDDELKKLKKVINDFKLKHPGRPLLFFNWPLNEVVI